MCNIQTSIFEEYSTQMLKINGCLLSAFMNSWNSNYHFHKTCTFPQSLTFNFFHIPCKWPSIFINIFPCLSYQSLYSQANIHQQLFWLLKLCRKQTNSCTVLSKTLSIPAHAPNPGRGGTWVRETYIGINYPKLAPCTFKCNFIIS